MQITLMKSKLHNARVTGGNVNYQGSLGVSREMMEAVGFIAWEKILVSNCENGERLETYIIPVDEPGQIILNGAAAHKGKSGDRIIIMSFAHMTPEEAETFKPRVAIIGDKNKVIKVK